MTAKELLASAEQFNQSAQAIDDFVSGQADPYSDAWAPLRAHEKTILDSASHMEDLAIDAVADDVKGALDQLNVAVKDATTTLGQIKTAEQALSIAASLASAAAGVATGNVLAGATTIAGLASKVADAADPPKDGGDPTASS